MHTHKCTRTHTHVHSHMHAYTHMLTHKYTHTGTHILTNKPSEMQLARSARIFHPHVYLLFLYPVCLQRRRLRCPTPSLCLLSVAVPTTKPHTFTHRCSSRGGQRLHTVVRGIAGTQHLRRRHTRKKIDTHTDRRFSIGQKGGSESPLCRAWYCWHTAHTAQIQNYIDTHTLPHTHTHTHALEIRQHGKKRETRHCCARHCWHNQTPVMSNEEGKTRALNHDHRGCKPNTH